MSLIDGLNERVSRLEVAFAEVVGNFDNLGRQLHDLTEAVAELQRSTEVEAQATPTRAATATPKTSGKTAT